MRTFTDFELAQSEINRDLHEMGVPIDDTVEIYQYIYKVDNPDYTRIAGVNEDYVFHEWQERLAGDLNPGRSWKYAREIWMPRAESNSYPGQGRFAFTESDRAGGNYLLRLTDLIDGFPNSRQLYLSVWDRIVDLKRSHKRRTPSTLGYHFLVRNGKLHMTFLQRACDFVTFWANDVALASMLQHYVATSTDYEVGHFTHWIGSLHIYTKDLDRDAF